MVRYMQLSAAPTVAAMTVSILWPQFDEPYLTRTVVPNSLVYTNTLKQSLRACDNTAGCVDVSWVVGTPGACYMKDSAGAIRANSKIRGSRQIYGCITTSKLKLHRKRVAPIAPKKHLLAKRAGYYGLNYTFTRARVTATHASTALATVST
jgi:hypothetical protein